MNSEFLHAEIDKAINETFLPHPFEQITTADDLATIFSRFIALSQATPYLLSGGSKHLFWKLITSNKEVSPNCEVTTAVLTFLACDETGAQQVIQEIGPKALPEILNFRNYHSRILADDLERLMGQRLKALYEDYTMQYFNKLLDELSDVDDIKRCAAIIAFETHAEQVIKALWKSLDQLFPATEKRFLKYFELHVGELNPVEAYHVEMTTKMVEAIVPSDKFHLFLEAFKSSYKLNNDWSKYTIGR